MPNCPECDEELEYLDYIVNRLAHAVEYRLYVCRNEDCDGFGRVYHCSDDDPKPRPGDPSGCY